MLFHLAFVSLASLTLCGLIIYSVPLHGKWTSDTINKIQGLHDLNVPRLGGVCVLISVLLFHHFSDVSLNGLGPLLFSATPIFLLGLAEDLKIPIPPLYRLAGAAFSGFLAALLFDVWLTRVDIPFVDVLLQYAFFGILCSVLATTALCHSYNLIDGLNGLSSGLFFIAITNLGFICFFEDALEISYLAFIFGAAAFGFWLLNFFTGRIFLGDGGAYLFGHVVVWLSILAVNSVSSISAWALLLNTVLPIADTILAILRRYKNNANVVEPDKEHFHHTIFFALEAICEKRGVNKWRNSLASALLIFVGFACSCLTFFTYHSSSLSASLCLLIFVLICGIKLTLRPA